MRGRKPKMNWQKSKGQFTTTIEGQFFRLGTEKTDAEERFRFLLNKFDLGETPDSNPLFSVLVDKWLKFVEDNHDSDRFRLCYDRLEEFVEFVGAGIRVQELRPRHVEDWLASKTNVKAPGTKRNYTAIILACLNWAASKKKGKGNLISMNPLRGLLDLPEGGSRGDDVVWPKKVFDMVLKFANPAFADVVRILAWTGARPSTICKVEARHYRKKWLLWDVEDLYKHRKTRKKYVKRIRLLPQAIPIVERLNEAHPEGPIFRNSHGDAWTPDTLGVYLYQMRHKFHDTKKMKWPKGLCLYGLRHTFATAFLMEHPNEIEYLRVLLGHKDHKMIFQHYGHLVDQHAAINGKLKNFDPFRS